MQLTFPDWAIIVSYLLFSVGVGIYFSRRASRNMEEYFLSGRTLPWWVVGTSMVATTFAADTPLAITEFVRGPGIWQNWFWWNEVLVGMLAVFLFSRLWRRARVITDNELLEIRYSGKPAAFLRLFKATYFSLLYNFIVMGWVINAMAAVVSVMLNIDRWVAVWSCVAIALLYAFLSGFWGVVITDLVQFVIAMAGSILLAVIAVNAVGGMDALIQRLDNSTGIHQKISEEIRSVENQLEHTYNAVEQQKLSSRLTELQTRLRNTPRVTEHTLDFIPPVPDAPFFSRAFWESPFARFLIFLLMLWWSTHKTDGGGYIIQRMSSARNERHALLATLWFNLTHYALRVWPWVAVGLVSVVVFPDVSGWKLGDKVAYPLVMQKFLGPGLKGLLIVSFLAAFMSTIDTHLNWGTSYLINDIYKRFIKPENRFPSPEKAQRHYVLVSKLFTILLMVVASFVALKMRDIGKAWEFVIAMGAGIGLVLILRWFWWRINAWTEIAALGASLSITILFEVIAAIQTIAAGEHYTLFGRSPVLWGFPLQIHHKLLIVVSISILVWVTVTLFTAPENPQTLRNFYRRVQPGGWWKPVARDIPATQTPIFKGFWKNWIAGVMMIWGSTFAIGNFLFCRPLTGSLFTILAISGFFFIWKYSIRKLS